MTKTYYLRFGSGNPSSNSGLAPTFIVFRNASGVTTAPGITEVATTGVYYFDYECTGTIAFVADGATTGLANADRYIAGSLDISDRLNEFLGLASDAVGFSSIFGQVYTAIGNGNTLSTRVGAIGDGAGFSTLFGQAIGGYDNSQSLVARVGTVADAAGFSSLFGQAIGAYNNSQSLIARVGTSSDVIGDSGTDPTSLFGFLKRCDNVLEGDSDYTKATGVFRMYDKTGATLLASKTITDASGVITKT